MGGLGASDGFVLRLGPSPHFRPTLSNLPFTHRLKLNTETFYNMGWCRFEYDSALAGWVEHALPSARETVAAEKFSRWMRCGGTWLAGVNALANDRAGAIAGSGPLQGVAIEFVKNSLGLSGFDWDKGQVSVCYPGYPKPMDTESPAAFCYRRERDAAHVDGLLPEGPRRRRYLREFHGFVLGIPMGEFSADASPLVVWEGSHEVIRAAIKARFESLPPDRWGEEDITDAYHEARRSVFDTCKRVEISGGPGEAFITHRLILHGVAPWGVSASAGADGRMIVYFRPDIGGPVEWLMAP